MKIDNAIKVFTEKYDEEAMRYIDELSSEIGLKHHGFGMKGIALQESFDKFSEYLEGYGNYKVKNMNNPNASTQDAIRSATEKFINESVFHEKKLKYCDSNKFVASYIEGVQHLLGKVDEVKNAMTEAGVDPEAIGDINSFTDRFMERVDSLFYPIMESLMKASGYTGKAFFDPKKPKTETPVFL